MNRILKTAAAAVAVLSCGLAQAGIYINTNANCYDSRYPSLLYSQSSVAEFPPTFKWSFQTHVTAYFANQPAIYASSGAFKPVNAEATVRHMSGAAVVAGSNYGFDGFAYYSVPTNTSSCSGVRIVQQTAAVPASLSAENPGDLNAAAGSAPAETADAYAAGTMQFVGIRIGTSADVPAALLELSKKRKAPGARALLASRMAQPPALATMSQLAATQGNDALLVAAANVDASPLQGVRMVGAMRGGAQTAAGWTGLTRLYEVAGGGTIVLDELDLAAAGGGAIVMRDLINADVNGGPARFEVTKAADGESAFLTWFAGNKRMSLMAPASADARVKLLAIARALY